MAIVALAIPIGVLINGVRVFFTGYLVHYVNPKLAEGFNHLTEGWLLFLVAFAILFTLRVGAEEKMMAEQFGDDYAAYSARTKRLVPGVW